MLIAFVHNNKSFLPAMQGYIDFFKNYNVRTSVCTATELHNLRPDVEWHFMGFDRTPKHGQLKIHDYSSASVPPFASLKNKLKKQLNINPDYRLFQNEFVCNSFGFTDSIPFGFRDVGIHPSNFVDSPVEKKHDFIYVGEMKSRKLDPLIQCFSTGALTARSILFLTKNYGQLAKSLKKYPNIHFAGPVAASEVRNYIRASQFGINYVLNVHPFNQQTSTKLLEYAANKTPIVTTDYPWIKEFQSKYGGKYFFLNHDLSNFSWDALQAVEFAFPDLAEWTWEHQIRKSGVLQFLSAKFNHLVW